MTERAIRALRAGIAIGPALAFRYIAARPAAGIST